MSRETIALTLEGFIEKCGNEFSKGMTVSRKRRKSIQLENPATYRKSEEKTSFEFSLPSIFSDLSNGSVEMPLLYSFGTYFVGLLTKGNEQLCGLHPNGTGFSDGWCPEYQPKKELGAIAETITLWIEDKSKNKNYGDLIVFLYVKHRDGKMPRSLLDALQMVPVSHTTETKVRSRSPSKRGRSTSPSKRGRGSSPSKRGRRKQGMSRTPPSSKSKKSESSQKRRGGTPQTTPTNGRRGRGRTPQTTPTNGRRGRGRTPQTTPTNSRPGGSSSPRRTPPSAGTTTNGRHGGSPSPRRRTPQTTPTNRRKVNSPSPRRRTPPSAGTPTNGRKVRSRKKTFLTSKMKEKIRKVMKESGKPGYARATESSLNRNRVKGEEKKQKALSPRKPLSPRRPVSTQTPPVSRSMSISSSAFNEIVKLVTEKMSPRNNPNVRTPKARLPRHVWCEEVPLVGELMEQGHLLKTFSQKKMPKGRRRRRRRSNLFLKGNEVDGKHEEKSHRQQVAKTQQFMKERSGQSITLSSPAPKQKKTDFVILNISIYLICFYLKYMEEGYLKQYQKRSPVTQDDNEEKNQLRVDNILTYKITSYKQLYQLAKLISIATTFLYYCLEVWAVNTPIKMEESRGLAGEDRHQTNDTVGKQSNGIRLKVALLTLMKTARSKADLILYMWTLFTFFFIPTNNENSVHVRIHGKK